MSNKYYVYRRICQLDDWWGITPVKDEPEIAKEVESVRKAMKICGNDLAKNPLRESSWGGFGVSRIPFNEGCANADLMVYYIKFDANGTTFVVCSQELPWLNDADERWLVDVDKKEFEYVGINR